MKRIDFPFEEKPSKIFGKIFRPLAKVSFWSAEINNWIEVIMIVDTGADYTLLPHFYAQKLGLSFNKDCRAYSAAGIGGEEKVFLFKKTKVKLGEWEGFAPVGFLDRDDIPPLLGRQGFLELFKAVFFRHRTYFSNPLK